MHTLFESELELYIVNASRMYGTASPASSNYATYRVRIRGKHSIHNLINIIIAARYIYTPVYRVRLHTSTMALSFSPSCIV